MEKMFYKKCEWIVSFEIVSAYERRFDLSATAASNSVLSAWLLNSEPRAGCSNLGHATREQNQPINKDESSIGAVKVCKRCIVQIVLLEIVLYVECRLGGGVDFAESSVRDDIFFVTEN